jgi:hypothetical protein
MPVERTDPGVLRGRRRGRVPPSILLIGTAGAGKRPVGHFLAEQLDFVHLDFEDPETRARFLAGGTRVLRARLRAIACEGRGLVITWRAGPPEQLRDVRRLRSLGVEPVWFDSDRGAACPAHLGGARRRPRFRFVNSFEADGSFRPVEAVVADLLAAAKRPRRTPVRALAAVVSGPPFRPRPSGRNGSGSRLGGGLAFSTAPPSGRRPSPPR